MKKTSSFAIALLLVPWLACDQPQQPASKLSVAPVNQAEEILPPSPDTLLPSGRKNIYLAGLRSRHGFYVERSTFPAGYKGFPHVHNSDIYVTILKGSAYLIMGSTFDTTVPAKPYGPGSFIVIKADQPHYEWFTETCTMQIGGIGPNETYFLSDKASRK